jgi:hypothetical protein
MTCSDFIRAQDLPKAGEIGILGIDGLAKRKAARGVLVPVVHERVVGEGREVREGGVHLLARALEETAAARDEECVAGEDATRVLRVRRVGRVETNGVLRVARCCETPVMISIYMSASV